MAEDADEEIGTRDPGETLEDVARDAREGGGEALADDDGLIKPVPRDHERFGDHRADDQARA